MPGFVAGNEDPAKVGVLVCDIDGVVYRGSESIPGAGEALRRIAGIGIEVLFATNNATRTPEAAAAMIGTRTGFSTDPSCVVTSGTATASWLAAEGIATALVVGEPALEEVLEREGIRVVGEQQPPEAVVVGIDRRFSYGRLAAAMRAVLDGAVFYATNTDVTFPTADGLVPGAGATVAAVQAASGVDPIVCGKPHEPMGALLRGRAAGRRVLVVGDRPETDLALGVAEGWETVLVMTGVTETAETVPRHLAPSHIAGSLADVADLLADR